VDERHRVGFDHSRTGYWMPACAGMTTECLAYT